jgi:hypothetical protein
MEKLTRIILRLLGYRERKSGTDCTGGKVDPRTRLCRVEGSKILSESPSENRIMIVQSVGYELTAWITLSPFVKRSACAQCVAWAVYSELVFLFSNKNEYLATAFIVAIFIPLWSVTFAQFTERSNSGLQNVTFRGPCIVIYSYNESQRVALFLKFIW